VFHHTERVMAIISFEIVSVPVADQERSKVFYQEILGFDLLREESMGQQRHRWRPSFVELARTAAFQH
jgi:catechol 2,3-dioxygenase-like lactoylglutathione lyase family enzyme